MNNVLDWLWPIVDTPEPVVADHVVAAWPVGIHRRLVDLAFLVQAADADRVLCPECQGHYEEVIASDGPDGLPRFYIPCPEVQRAQVLPDARRRWSVNLAGVADALAAALALTGTCTELLASRLWRLGRTLWQGSPRDVMLARGLRCDDAPIVRASIVRGRKPIVFVPDARPSDDLWRGRVPPILALSQVATFGDKGIEVDPVEVTAAIQDAEDRANTSNTIVIGMEQLKQAIRQQVKAEEKTSLSDDVFVAAYRQHGSVRQAAEFLSQQTGKDVSKDQVHRALQRAGGAAAVLNDENSDSVVRSSAGARGRKVKKTNQSTT